jgi:DNA-binding SARP family transcriptional activator
MPLSISLFGPFDVRVNGDPLPRLRSRKGYWLLALLVLRHDREVERSWLAGTLWPDDPEPQAFASLRNSLKDLRQALGSEARRLGSPTPRTLALDLEGVEVDLLAFDAAVASGDAASFEKAVARYRGPLLEGWVEEWVLPDRQAREEAFLAALERRAAQAKAANDPGGAAQWLRRTIAIDPLREAAQRALMEALAAGGEYAAATEAYRGLRLLLHRELNAEPAPETSALYQQIRTEARQRAEAGRQKADGRRQSGEPPVGWSGSNERPTVGSSEEPSRLPTADCLPPPCASLFPTPPAPPSTASTDCLLPTDLEPVGGAVPLDSPFYVPRPADEEFRAAIARRDSIILVKGTHQAGKTSLLARVLQFARQTGARVVLTDFEKLNTAHMESAEALLLSLGQSIADQLDLDVFLVDVWDSRRGPNQNFERFWQREVLARISVPLVWGLDQVDRLFSCDFGGEIFGLFRSWHNERALDPLGPWARLSLAIAYATEAQLFITDPNKSPFNVGTRLALEDFDCDQVAELNRRHGAPLKQDAEGARLRDLVGGHPYLVRRALHEMAAHGTDLPTLETRAASDEWIFGDHLRRMRALIGGDPELREAMQAVLRGQPCPTPASFYRLRSAGVIAGESERDARPRCRLYAIHLERHLRR